MPPKDYLKYKQWEDQCSYAAWAKPVTKKRPIRDTETVLVETNPNYLPAGNEVK